MSVSPTFYVLLLRSQIPKAQKRQSTQAAFLRFWDLLEQKFCVNTLMKLSPCHAFKYANAYAQPSQNHEILPLRHDINYKWFIKNDFFNYNNNNNIIIILIFTKASRQAKQGGEEDKVDLLGQVSKGVIPGVPGQDYPVNSIDALKKKNPGSFSNLQPAPAHLITPGRFYLPILHLK